MSELAFQARWLINAASEAISAQWKESPSSRSAMLARKIVSEAQKQRPHNLLLQSIDLDAKAPDWNDVSTAMSVVVNALD